MARVRVAPAVVEQAIRHTDWHKVDALTDAEIARGIAADPDAPPVLTEGETAAALARTVRLRLGRSQAAFARRFHVPLGTLPDWEQNRRQPDATAQAYLRVIARAPEVVARALAA
jgi:putative transcriptional regulator